MKCNKCGYKNINDIKFCMECGSPLTAKETRWIDEGSSDADVYASHMDRVGMETYKKNLSADIRAMEQDRAGMKNYNQDFHSDSYSMEMDRRGITPQKPVYFHSSYYSPSLPSGNDVTLLPMAKEGWNWGAFMFGWIWLLCHNMVPWGIGLLLLSYFLGPLTLAASIYLGIKGNELAWTYRPFRNLQHFEETERVWNSWGLIIFIVEIVFVILFFFLMFFSGLS